MSIELINVGSGRLATDGECIRDAFIKINSNFEQLNTGTTTTTTTSTQLLNLVDGDGNILGNFDISENGQDLNFTVTNNLNLNNAITIDNSQNITFPSGTSIDFSGADLNLDLNKLNQFDVDFDQIQDGMSLTYNASTGKFEATTSSGTVTEESVTQYQSSLSITESQISDLTHYTNGDVDTHLNTSTATTNQLLSWNGTDYDWITQSSDYTLPTATNEILGGIKIGSGLSITQDGVVSTSGGGSDIYLVDGGAADSIYTNGTLILDGGNA